MKINLFKTISISILLLTSCASSVQSVHQTNQTETPKVVLSPSTVSESKAPAEAEPTIKMLPVTTVATANHVAAAPAAHKPSEGVAPEQALKWLKNGNRRFVKGFFRNDGASKKDIVRLSTGQKPHSVVLSCSDSRVPPEVVFDQKLGEIFVVRTAGEALDSAAIASIEYAVEHLGSRNILVMGHTQCGAVKAALATMEGQDAGSSHLNKLVADIHPRLAPFSGKAASKNYVDEVWANTKGVAQDLLDRSTIIAEKVKSGEVQISSAVYHLDSGKAEFGQ